MSGQEIHYICSNCKSDLEFIDTGLDLRRDNFATSKTEQVFRCVKCNTEFYLVFSMKMLAMEKIDA